MSFENAIELLCSHNKLEKDKGAHQFEKLLATKTYDCDTHIKGLQDQLLKVLRDDKSTWEQKHGSLIAFHCLIRSSSTNRTLQNEFVFQILESALQFLSYNEPMVCQAAVALLENLFQRFKTEVNKNWRQTIVQHIQTDLDQLLDCDQCIENEIENLNIGKNVQDDCAGWKRFEPSIKVLKYIIEGCDGSFLGNRQLISLIIKICGHANHLVREAGFNLLSSLLQNLNLPDSSGENPLLCLGELLSHNIRCGLDDNCGQVRLAASIAARNFLLSFEEKDRLLFYSQLLPPICLNRYYATDVVRIYCQETWRQVAGASGRDLVDRFIDPAVEYYIKCARSENNGVREASCSCISELLANIPVETLHQFIPILLNTLLDCFQDKSWTVREAACIACGNCVTNFPQECSIVLDKLYSMFYIALGDHVTSVQQSAAFSLSSIVRTFGVTSLTVVLAFLEDGLKNIQLQKGDIGLSSKKEHNKRPAECPERQNICDKSNTPQPWQTSNGCVYLLGELSNIKEASEKVAVYLPLLKNAASFRNYVEHVIFLETFCKQLPIIAKNLGKHAFLNYIILFVDDIFYALECENRMTSSAASKCLNQLATLLGQNVLRNKITECNASYVSTFESVIFVAPF